MARDSIISFGDSTIQYGFNHIWTDNGAFRIQNNPLYNFSTILNAGITAGVSIGTPLAPQSKLQIHQDDIGGIHQPVHTLYTNEINGYVIPSTTGFKVGISAGLNGEIRQERNLPLNFFTDNNQRMTILGNGFTGIGTTTPVRRLEVFDADSAQLRLTYNSKFNNSLG